MAKPTGFMEYRRELPNDRSPRERIEDWQEFHLHMSDLKLQEQGARCMDCGVPFCHLGDVVSAGDKGSGCPINNLIPEWNDLVYRGLWREALERLHKTNNFPEFTGRVCPAPCEGACVLGINNPPVTIKNIECAIADKGFASGWIQPNPPAKRTGRKVAVVGSGPAGLSCAAQLNKAGHWVTVYERSDRIGGLLMYGIPNMKLDKGYVQRRVDLLESEGITFTTSCQVGVDVPAADLVAQYDSVVLCIGRHEPPQPAGPRAPVEGDSPGHRLPSRQYQKSPRLKPRRRPLHLRQRQARGRPRWRGYRNRLCRYLDEARLQEPGPVRHYSRPSPRARLGQSLAQWPLVYRLDYGQEEAQAVFGKDPRSYLISTTRFDGDASGQVKALHTRQVEWVTGEDGRPFREIEGTEKVWPADLVLLSLGWLGPEPTILDELGLERDERSNAKAALDQYTTRIPGVFVAGDARRGASLVVWAFKEGRGAARECDRYLMGQTDLP